MFRDHRVFIGVGLNDFDFHHSTSMCGACIWVHSVFHFANLDEELAEWYDGEFHDDTQGFYAIVMDQCTDLICVPGWLDFDVYSPTLFGNPLAIQWEFVPCPVNTATENIEILLCTSVSCHPQDPENRTVKEVFRAADPTYFALYVRNSRVPIYGIDLVGHGPLLDKNGWTFADGTVDWNRSSWELILYWESASHHSLVQHAFENTTAKGYRGGILYTLDFQN
jgi:hypothetical protein